MKRKKNIYKVSSRNRGEGQKNKIIFCLVILIIIIIIGIILVKLGIDTRKNIVPLYTFKAEKSNNYEILLKPNNFYMTQTLPSERYYASQSINGLSINFNYAYKANEKVDIEYNYTITAELIGRANTIDNQSKEVWSRIFNLNSNNEKINSEEFFINENINIEYPFYNNLARSYEENYGIELDAILKVRLNIFYNINLSNFGIEKQNQEDYIELDIPINNTVTTVNKNYEDVTLKDFTSKNRKFSIKEISFYISGGVLIISSIITIIVIIINNKNKKNPEDLYVDNINHILKYYRDLIVTVENEPNYEELEVIKVPLFEDLIDIAEQNRKNIIHYQIIEKAQSKLYVIVEKYVYMYVVTCNKIK